MSNVNIFKTKNLHLSFLKFSNFPCHEIKHPPWKSWSSSYCFLVLKVVSGKDLQIFSLSFFIGYIILHPTLNYNPSRKLVIIIPIVHSNAVVLDLSHCTHLTLKAYGYAFETSSNSPASSWTNVAKLRIQVWN